MARTTCSPWRTDRGRDLPDEYEFHLKNVFEEDAYEDFMERTQDMATDEFTPAPPMLDVNGTCYLGWTTSQTRPAA